LNRPIRALVLAVSLLTAACGGSSTASPPPGGQSPAASAAAGAASPAVAASASLSASGAGGGAGLCAFLSAEVPALQKAGSTGGTVGELAIDYANWIAADSSRVPSGAGAMDSLTQASCPEVRATVLKLIGGNSFATSF